MHLMDGIAEIEDHWTTVEQKLDSLTYQLLERILPTMNNIETRQHLLTEHKSNYLGNEDR